MCLGISRIDPQRRLIARDGFFRAPQVAERIAAVVECIGVCRHQRQRVLEATEGLHRLTHVLQDESTVVMGRCIARIDRKCLVDQRERFGEFASLIGNDPQMVQ